MRRSSDVATRLVVRKVPMMPRISISRRNGRMIWVRIRRVGIVSRLANTAPTLCGDGVCRVEEDELIGTAVLRREAVGHHRVGARVARRNPDRGLRDHGSVALVVDPDPLVEDPSPGAVGGKPSGRGYAAHGAALIPVVAVTLYRLSRRRDGELLVGCRRWRR